MTDLTPSSHSIVTLNSLSDQALQDFLLTGVSRTFALTIPQLPARLYPAVANAYLLCRIVDTVEDEVSLSVAEKQQFCARFIEVVKTGQNAQTFSDQLTPLLSTKTLATERQLIQLTPRVITMTHQLAPAQIEALANCVEVMGKGMSSFQGVNLSAGLMTLKHMDDYCYYVAGCVGEMLAKLFCHYSSDIAKHETELLALSVSFGQGLQMTNILKDIWDDAQRGVCWLPQDVFQDLGFKLTDLKPGLQSPAFQCGLERLISIAQQHLANALRYTLLIPAYETGIRKFCLWALGMAVLTLRNIKKHLDFTQGKQVKISRFSVKTTIWLSHFTVQSDSILSLLFSRMSHPLKMPEWQYLSHSPQPIQS